MFLLQAGPGDKVSVQPPRAGITPEEDLPWVPQHRDREARAKAQAC